MTQKGTLLLSREDVASLLTLPEYVEIVEEAFRAYAEGRTVAPGLLHADVPDGEFHVKSGGLELARPYFCLKANAGFYRNRDRFGLPNIQGMIVLYSAENGYPLALMDSIEITVNRTGAAGAVAAKHLARPESRVVTVCGCGTQGRIQLQALKEVLPVERVFAFDVDSGAARRFAAEMEGQLGLEVTVASDLPAAVGKSDVCVTCTPARHHFLKSEDVTPGTFVSAFGADSPEKWEIDPGLMASGTVVVDILEQCATVGELHHALRAGVMEEDDVHAGLGEVVTGRKAGRTAEEEITVFDATGTGLQDAASAAAAYERALERGRGTFFDFFGTEEVR
jgi:ornithine cyclodeaminase/alanine dehydrogenase